MAEQMANKRKMKGDAFRAANLSYRRIENQPPSDSEIREAPV